MIEIFILISQYYVFDFMCGWYNIKIFVENSALFYYEKSKVYSKERSLISQYYVFDFMCGWYNIKIFVENSALFYYEKSKVYSKERSYSKRAGRSVLWLFRSDWNRLNSGGIFQRSMIKNRIVVREKSTNKNRTFLLFS